MPCWLDSVHDNSWFTKHKIFYLHSKSKECFYCTAYTTPFLSLFAFGLTKLWTVSILWKLLLVLVGVAKRFWGVSRNGLRFWESRQEWTRGSAEVNRSPLVGGSKQSEYLWQRMDKVSVGKNGLEICGWEWSSQRICEQSVGDWVRVSVGKSVQRI